MPPRATAASSFYEFVWYLGCAFRVPTQIFPPMTLLLKAFISSLWQKIDYYPWHLMDSFHKRTIFFVVFMLAYKVPPSKKKKKTFLRHERISQFPCKRSSRHLQWGTECLRKKLKGKYRSELAVHLLASGKMKLGNTRDSEDLETALFHFHILSPSAILLRT